MDVFLNVPQKIPHHRVFVCVKQRVYSVGIGIFRQIFLSFKSGNMVPNIEAFINGDTILGVCDAMLPHGVVKINHIHIDLPDFLLFNRVNISVCKM